MARYYYHRIDHPNGSDYENYLAHEQWVMYQGLIHDQDIIDLTIVPDKKNKHNARRCQVR